jgi:hypothetical protein
MKKPTPIMKIETWSLQHIIDLAIKEEINSDPIGQRPPVSTNFLKSTSILSSIVDGYGLGALILRDITEEAAKNTEFEEANYLARQIYTKNRYLVIDGGHRIRALVAFYMGKLAVDGKSLMDMANDFDLNQIEVPVIIFTCDASQTSEVFRRINTTTPVNFMEMVMSDDVTPVLKDIRSLVKYYEEYDNVTHKIFSSTFNEKSNKQISDCFRGDPNPRRKWDEWIAIAIIKTIGKGNVDAGQAEIEDLANNVQEVPKSKMQIVKRMLDDALAFKNARGSKYSEGNSSDFAAFMLFWFELYSENNNFVINDFDKFKNAFMSAYSKLSDKKDERFRHIGGDIHDVVTKWFRKNVTSFAQGKVQKICFDLLLEEMNIELTAEGVANIGVTFRDKVRSKSQADREKFLAAQNYQCAIDGCELSLEDSVWAHDTPWSKGGSLEDGAVVRNEHNTNMGSLNLQEFRLVLASRNEIAKPFEFAA